MKFRGLCYRNQHLGEKWDFNSWGERTQLPFVLSLFCKTALEVLVTAAEMLHFCVSSECCQRLRGGVCVCAEFQCRE